jgi:nucleoside-diphosphate-sugar epimerase
VRLLVLGGTVFLGRWIVAAALARDHQVSIFTRGESNPELFPEVEHLRGDRDGGLGALERSRWDAVIDTSGYVPRIVRASAELLSRAAPHYSFVSSISAYDSFATAGLEENAPLAALEDPASESIQEHYGALKAACEVVVQRVYGDGALIVRPGLIVGPYDPTGRFTYWPTRVARGGDVLVPGRPERQVQFIDVRDLAEWQVRLAEDRVGGVFNATGPLPAVTMGELLEACRSVAPTDASLVWVDDAFLLGREVGEWQELPLWIADPDWQGLNTVDVSRAVASGLTFRPLAETVQATLDWARAHGDRPLARREGVQLPPAGLAAERELELLDEWRAAAA